MTTPFLRYKPIIDDWEAFQAVVQRPLPTVIWANPHKTTPARLERLLEWPLEPLAWRPGAFRLPPDVQPGLHWAYLAGLYQVQEEVSLLPVRLLDAQPGQRVIDLCAAPGNKTAQIAAALDDGGTLVANDRDAGRMRAARQTLNRLGLLNITTTTADGANIPRRAGQYNRVLVDVPCTCEGTCRKDPTVMERVTAADSHNLAGLQTALLRKGVQLCRPGGRIVYATCTFAPEENEAVVDAILREYGPEIIQLRPARVPGFVSSPGLTRWQNQTFLPELAQAMRVWPHQNDSGGFFLAMLEKTDAETTVGAAETPAAGETPLAAMPQEREEWLDLICGRFGFWRDDFAPYHIFRRSRRGVYLVNADHRPPARPEPDAIGMFFMRTDGKYPKLTTGAAMRFAPLARKNAVELSGGQMAAYVARRDVIPTSDQAAELTQGYVLLRYRGAGLGVGVYRKRQGIIESLFPKSWARDEIEW